MRGWHGHRVSDLVGTWGPPIYTYSDGHGGSVLVYVPVAEAATTPRPRPRPRDPDEVGQAPNLFEFQAAMTTAWPVYRVFFVDGLGRIARSQWRGTWVCCSR